MFVRLAVAALLASATITAVAPNPATDGDAGEFVAVRFPEEADTSGWTLADGETTAELPNRSLTGTVAPSTEPRVTRNRTDLPVVELDGALSLSNGGERVELRARNRTVDAVEYPSAPEPSAGPVASGRHSARRGSDRSRPRTLLSPGSCSQTRPARHSRS